MAFLHHTRAIAFFRQRRSSAIVFLLLLTVATFSAHSQSKVPVACIRPAPPDQPYVGNLYIVPLTAYTFVADPNSDGKRINTSNETVDIRLPNHSDSKIYPPVPPSGRIDDLNCYNSYGFPSHISAAIFSDGTVFGDRAIIDKIMTVRNLRQRDYKKVYEVVCSSAQQGKNLPQVSADLFQIPSGATESVVAQQLARRYFRQNAHTPAEVHARLVASLESLKAARNGLLADPVKDEHGKLYITDVPDATACVVP